MRQDGLRIDPEARPYGMHAVDLLAELAGGLAVDFRGAALFDHELALVLTLGARPFNFRRRGALSVTSLGAFLLDGPELVSGPSLARRTHNGADPQVTPGTHPANRHFSRDIGAGAAEPSNLYDPLIRLSSAPAGRCQGRRTA